VTTAKEVAATTKKKADETGEKEESLASVAVSRA
jgi:hypothetical protein